MGQVIVWREKDALTVDDTRWICWGQWDYVGPTWEQWRSMWTVGVVDAERKSLHDQSLETW